MSVDLGPLGIPGFYGDLLRQIFSYLPISDLPSVSKTCRMFRSAVNNDLMKTFLQSHSKADFVYLKDKTSRLHPVHLLDFFETQKHANFITLCLIVNVSKKWLYSDNPYLFDRQFHLFDYLEFLIKKLNRINTIRTQLIEFVNGFCLPDYERSLQYAIVAKEYLDNYDHKMVEFFKSRINECIETIPLHDRPKDLECVDSFIQDIRYKDLKLLCSSKNQKDPFAILLRAFLCQKVQSKSLEDQLESYKMVKRSVDSGLVFSLCYLGVNYKGSNSVNLNYLRDADSLGDPKATLRLADIEYEHQNFDAAYSLVQRAAKTGYFEAQKRLGLFLLKGTGVKVNLPLAIQYLKKFAKLPEIAYELGKAYLFNEGLCKREAIYWLKQSANDRNPEAMYLLGLIYFYGYMVEKDIHLATSLFLNGGVQMHTPSIILLLALDQSQIFNISNENFSKYRDDPYLSGLMHQKGIYFSKDFSSAKSVFEKSRHDNLFCKLHLASWKEEIHQSMIDLRKSIPRIRCIKEMETVFAILDQAVLLQWDLNLIQLLFNQFVDVALNFKFQNVSERLYVFLKIKLLFDNVKDRFTSQDPFVIYFHQGQKSESLNFPTFYKILFQSFSSMASILDSPNVSVSSYHFQGVLAVEFQNLLEILTGNAYGSLYEYFKNHIEKVILLGNYIGVTGMILSGDLLDLTYNDKYYQMNILCKKFYNECILKRNRQEDFEEFLNNYFTSYHNHKLEVFVESLLDQKNSLRVFQL